MRKKLLFLSLPFLLFTVFAQAQDHVWDFGNDETNFPVGPAFSDTQVIDGLTLVAGGSSFGTVEPNSGTWSDGYSSTNRFKSEGNSSVDASGLPTRRYMEFPVTGPVSVKLWFRFSGSSTPRAVVIADNTGAEIVRFDSVGDTDRRYIEADYTGSASSILVFSEGNAVNYYKLEVSSTLLNVDDVDLIPEIDVRSVKNKVFVSNVTSDVEINVYNITGVLVKTIKTNEDLNFQLEPGIYIAHAISSGKSQTFKLLSY